MRWPSRRKGTDQQPAVTGVDEVIDLRDPIADATYYDETEIMSDAGVASEGVAGADAPDRASDVAASVPSQGARAVASADASAWGEHGGAAFPGGTDLADDFDEWAGPDEPDSSGGFDPGDDPDQSDEFGSEAAASKRPSSRRKRWAIRLALLGALVAAIAGIGAFVVLGPFMRVEAVQLTGADGASQAELLRAADVGEGQPMATVPIDEVADRIASLPQVSEVTVAREYPRTLAIDVQMRTPVAQVMVDGKSVLVDGQGVAYTEPAKPAKRLPAIEAPTPELLASGAAVAETLPTSIRRRTETISAPARNQVELKLRKGQRVLWGDASEPELKGKVLMAMLKPIVIPSAMRDDMDTDPPVFTWFDVSTPTAPTAAVVMPESRANRCEALVAGSSSTNVPEGCTAADLAAAQAAADAAGNGTGDASAGAGEQAGQGAVQDQGTGQDQGQIPSDTAD